MNQLNLKIVTPERVVYQDMVSEVLVPSESGELGILPHHINLMTKLTHGELKIKKDSKEERLAVGEGLLQIVDNTVTIMTDLAVNERDIDEKAVEEARKRADRALEDKLSDEEYAETLAILEKSLIQLKVKRRHRSI